MAQIQLTDEYNSQGGIGGTCYLCNASKRITDRPERIITTNMEVDYDAEPGVWPVKWLEFCETCVLEMGHLLDMKLPSEMPDYRSELANLQAENDDLKAQLSANVKVVESFQALMNWLPKPVESVPALASAVAPSRRR